MRSKHDFPSVNAKAPEGLRPTGKPYGIMLVDPHDFSRKQIKQILESEQYKIVAEAKNGREAIAVIKKLGAQAKTIDLIATELDMPDVDGYALLYELKEMNVAAKVVFISEDTTKGVIQDLLKMGAIDYILKPIQRTKLLERIKLACKRIS